ncbi:DUF4142 domain-containing protein [Alienimonas chondri]|uniref:DUF4142 domain-containing protein n=1 Tax=Alienimonas chondri TaxID=2681879 RepID=A0ABX1VFW8_9PLAN|nr:DUF4142 domain-containing protein [Alienimonas chondri]NNJ26921.1 hypothetical protein [Alienimonas chondri]
MIRLALRPLSATLAATLCVAPALAQQEGDDASAVVPDRQILSLLTPLNRTEVDISKFAAERAVSPEVKDFARKMVEAHEALARDLSGAARRANAQGDLPRGQRRRAGGPLRDRGVVGEEAAERAEEVMEQREEVREERAEARREIVEERVELEEESREEIREAREDVREERIDSLGGVVDEAVRDAREAGDEIDEEVRELGAEARRTGRRMRNDVREGAATLAGRADRELNGSNARTNRPAVNLRRKALAKSHQMVKESLGAQRGCQFDMAYLNHQMLAHLKMLAAVQVSAEHAGPELKTVLREAERKIDGHLNQARELAMKVDRMED